MPSESPSTGQTPQFVQHLTGCQSALYAYISSLLGGLEGARDVLQETNLVLWGKAGTFDPSRPFLPWAYTFARFQVMAWRKKQSRDRLILDDDLLDQVAGDFEGLDSTAELQLEALERCMTKLPPSQRQLVDSRYVHGEGVNQIADRMGMEENVVSASLYRIRRALMRCVESTLGQGVGS